MVIALTAAFDGRNFKRRSGVLTDFTRRDSLIGGAAVFATVTPPAVPLVAEIRR
jgi:hypothetical protein